MNLLIFPNKEVCIFCNIYIYIGRVQGHVILQLHNQPYTVSTPSIYRSCLVSYRLLLVFSVYCVSECQLRVNFVSTPRSTVISDSYTALVKSRVCAYQTAFLVEGEKLTCRLNNNSLHCMVYLSVCSTRNAYSY